MANIPIIKSADETQLKDGDIVFQSGTRVTSFFIRGGPTWRFATSPYRNRLAIIGNKNVGYPRRGTQVVKVDRMTHVASLVGIYDTWESPDPNDLDHTTLVDVNSPGGKALSIKKFIEDVSVLQDDCFVLITSYDEMARQFSEIGFPNGNVYAAPAREQLARCGASYEWIHYLETFELPPKVPSVEEKIGLINDLAQTVDAVRELIFAVTGHTQYWDNPRVVGDEILQLRQIENPILPGIGRLEEPKWHRLQREIVTRLSEISKDIKVYVKYPPETTGWDDLQGYAYALVGIPGCTELYTVEFPGINNGIDRWKYQFGGTVDLGGFFINKHVIVGDAIVRGS